MWAQIQMTVSFHNQEASKMSMNEWKSLTYHIKECDSLAIQMNGMLMEGWTSSWLSERNKIQRAHILNFLFYKRVGRDGKGKEGRGAKRGGEILARLYKYLLLLQGTLDWYFQHPHGGLQLRTPIPEYLVPFPGIHRHTLLHVHTCRQKHTHRKTKNNF